MQSKALAALAGMALAVGMLFTIPQTAMAANDAKTLTLQATVNTSITISFTNGQTFNLGAINQGGRASLFNDSIEYNVTTNDALGFHLDLNNDGVNVDGYNGGTGNGVTFSLCKSGVCVDNATSFQTNGVQVVGANMSLISGGANWRTQSGPGSFTYADEAQVLAGSNAVAQSYAAHVQYLATAN